jgi:acetolactate synthase-1/3 small subunit
MMINLNERGQAHTPAYVTTTTRTGCSNAPQGTEQVHTLVILVADRPGSVDRVVGVLRRRRAKLQSFNLSQSEMPELMRITALVKDTEVGVEHLFEQIRKIVDVRQVRRSLVEQATLCEMALVNVSTVSASVDTIVSAGQEFGARVVETASESVTLGVTGTEGQITACIEAMRVYGVCDVARSGCVALVP